MKLILFLPLIVAQVVFARPLRGVDSSGGADYVAEVSCYFESANNIWTTVDIKNALVLDDRNFPENAHIKMGAMYQQQTQVSEAEFLSMTPDRAQVTYSGHELSMWISLSPMRSPENVIHIDKEIAQIYSILPSRLKYRGVKYQGFCVRDVEFYLAHEFAPLK